MPKPLTSQEQDVLEYLLDYVRRNTYQPSIREIAAQFDIRSTKTVSELLQALADKGWIERTASRSRGVRLLTLDLCADVVSVPHVDVHLNELSLEDPIESLALDRRVAASSASFLVTMAGDEWAEQGIRNGDLLLVEPRAEAEPADGELLLCRLGKEAGVRRLRREDGSSILESGRLDQPPALLDGVGGAEVLGRIVAVIRRLHPEVPASERTPAERTPSEEGVAAG